MAPIYVIDANPLIEAANRYYSFDIDSRFWSILVELAQRGRVLSIDRVHQELKQGRDELAKWANEQFSRWFASTDQDDVISEYRKSWNGLMSKITLKIPRKHFLPAVPMVG